MLFTISLLLQVFFCTLPSDSASAINVAAVPVLDFGAVNPPPVNAPIPDVVGCI